MLSCSLIISSKNRSKKLFRCLGCINANDMIDDSFELILVDNNSTDDTFKVMTAFQQQAPFNVKVIQEKQPGLSHGRNAGINAAKSDIIIFTDDDCYMADEYLTALQTVFSDKTIDFATGRVLLYDPSDTPLMTNTGLIRKIIDTDGLKGIPPIIGANLAIRKSIIEKTGEFDPFFGTGSNCAGDDLDYIVRVLRNGFKGVYDPNLVTHHHHGRQDKEQIKNQEKFYARGIGAIYCKRLMEKEPMALAMLLKSISKQFKLPVFELDQDQYKECMIDGALAYLNHCLKL